jgi:hypothetical protein
MCHGPSWPSPLDLAFAHPQRHEINDAREISRSINQQFQHLVVTSQPHSGPNKVHKVSLSTDSPA